MRGEGLEGFITRSSVKMERNDDDQFQVASHVQTDNGLRTRNHPHQVSKPNICNHHSSL